MEYRIDPEIVKKLIALEDRAIYIEEHFDRSLNNEYNEIIDEEESLFNELPSIPIDITIKGKFKPSSDCIYMLKENNGVLNSEDIKDNIIAQDILTEWFDETGECSSI